MMPLRVPLFLSIEGPDSALPTAASDSALLSPGARVRVLARVSRFHDYRNPGAVTAGHRSVALFGRAQRNGVLRLDAEDALQPRLVQHRQHLRRLFAAHLGDDAARLARALVLGESSALTQPQRKALRQTGTSHLVAVSGLHLGIVAWLCYAAVLWGLRRIPALTSRCWPGAIAAIITIPALAYFALLTGGRAPVLRALTMSVCVLLGTVLSRRASGAESVSLAAILLLVADPQQLFSPGFQLSFGAIVGFLIFAPQSARTLFAAAMHPTPTSTPAERLGARLKRWTTQRLYPLWHTNVVACAVTGPIAAWHFGALPLTAVFFNMVLIPLTSALLMPALMGAALLGTAFPAAAPVLLAPVQWLLAIFEGALFAFARVSPLPIIAGALPLALALCCSAGMLALVRRRWRLGLSSVTLACAGLLFLQPWVRQVPQPGALTIDFLDVGQGDSTLITFPDGRHWLVDAGGTAAKDIGEEHLAPILAGLGVRRLDTVVLTHFDPDHIAGMPRIAQHIEVGRYLMLDPDVARHRESTEAFAALMTAVEAPGTPVVTPRDMCGERDVSGVQVAVLHPCAAPQWLEGLSANDSSIVLRLRYQGISVLLTGDLSAAGEAILLREGVDVRAHVLKAGHHGSRSSTSRAFLAAVAPQWAVASLGPFNRYGFPHAEVRENLAAAAVGLWRTDQHGAVRLTVRNGRCHMGAQKGADGRAYVLPTE